MGKMGRNFLLELEGAELLVDNLPDDLVGRHVCGRRVGEKLSFSILARRITMTGTEARLSFKLETEVWTSIRIREAELL
jgi:hypothetical protein